MNERLFIQLCEMVLGIATIGGIIFILAATWYDLRTIRYRRYLQTLKTAMTGRREPSITVLVYARNTAASLEACLNSIGASHYKNYKIIVADNCSHDDTKKYLAQYKQAHPSIPLLTYRASVATDRSTALRQAYKKDKSSQLLVLVEGTDTIPSMLLQESAARFAANDDLDVLRLRLLVTNDLSIASLPHYFSTLSKNIIDKSLARFSLLAYDPTGSGIVLKSSLFKKESTGVGRKMSVDYASTLTFSRSLLNAHSIFTPQPRLVRSRPWKKIASLFLVAIGLTFTICVVTYFFYTASTLQSNVLLTLSWAVLCLWLLAVIWLDDVYQLSKRIELTLTVPFMYFIFYAQSIIVFAVTVGKMIQLMPTLDMSLNKIRDVVQLELYSTRY